jgi:hypothetical protein
MKSYSIESASIELGCVFSTVADQGVSHIEPQVCLVSEAPGPIVQCIASEEIDPQTIMFESELDSEEIVETSSKPGECDVQQAHLKLCHRVIKESRDPTQAVNCSKKDSSDEDSDYTPQTWLTASSDEDSEDEGSSLESDRQGMDSEHMHELDNAEKYGLSSGASDSSNSEDEDDIEPEDPLVCLLPPLPPDLIGDFAEEAARIPRGRGAGNNGGRDISSAFAARVEAEEIQVEMLLSVMRRDPKVREWICKSDVWYIH